MSNIIQTFKTIDDEMFEKLGVQSELLFHYLDEESQKQNLIYKTDLEKSLVLQHPTDRDAWDFAYHGLVVTINLAMDNSDLLFTPEGVANSDTVLGIAAKWYSTKSTVQHIEHLFDIRKGQRVENNATLTIPNERIYGDLCIELVVYVKGPSIQPAFGFANLSGMVIDTLDYFRAAVDGQGGLFPIITVADDNRPLWFMEFSIEDPKVDSFNSNHITICINKKSRLYTSIIKRETKVGARLMDQIIASSLVLLMFKLKEEYSWQEIDAMKDNEFEEGSIIAAVKYFRNAMNWDFTSSEALMESIVLYFENLGGVDNA